MTSRTQPSDTRSLRVETFDSGSATGIILRGEADIATLLELRTALASIKPDGMKPVHMYVAELEFCDGGSLRELVRFARDMRQGGHHVTTVGAKPLLREIAVLLSAAGDLGLP